MEMGVRKAEAARRRASAGGGDPQGEGAHPSFLDEAQATRMPPSPAAILPALESCLLQAVLLD